jgi:hypothetical protein
MIIINKYKLYKNYIIYTSSEFQDKWDILKLEFGTPFDMKLFFKDLVAEIGKINENLLTSLYNFAEKRDCLLLCNLIYESNKKKFKNPLIEDESYFIKSSVFTPPNNFLEDHWTKYYIPFGNLDEVF